MIHDFPRERLCELIERYGPSVCHDPLRFQGLIRDFCPNSSYYGAVNVLITALKERVALDLAYSTKSVPTQVLLARLTRRLRENRGIEKGTARWAVESWALALGKISKEELRSAVLPEVRPRPRSWRWILGALVLLGGSVFLLLLGRPRRPSSPTPLATPITAPSPPSGTIPMSTISSPPPPVSTPSVAPDTPAIPPSPTPSPMGRLSRTERSPLGDIRIEFRDGDSGRTDQSVWLVPNDDDLKRRLLCRYTTAARVSFSPDEAWLVVTEYPATRSNSFELYRRSPAGGADFTPDNISTAGVRRDDAVWQLYKQENGLPETLDKKEANIDCVGWKPGSSTFFARVTPYGPDGPNTIPAPFFCSYDVGTQKLQVLSDRATRAAAALPWVQANVRPCSKLPPLGFPTRTDNQDRQWIVETVRAFVMMNQVADPEALLSFYSPDSVDYFGSGPQKPPFIRQFLRDYNERWPVRLGNTSSEVNVEEIVRGERYKARFEKTYYYESRGRGEWTSGRLSTDLELVVQDGVPQITAIHQKTIHDDKGQLAATNAPSSVVATPLPAASASPAKENLSRYPRHGRIYKVPELERLVGQKLQNAWLYGEFHLKGVEGNVASLVTTPFGISHPEGNTWVEVEYQGGVQLSQWARFILDTKLPKPIPVSFSVGDPLQILSVSRAGGKLLVRGRTHLRLTP
jgi:hypothetical protein